MVAANNAGRAVARFYGLGSCSQPPTTTRETCSAPVSLGLGPHSHLGHREKECADLMMHRKSDEPHSDPGAAIGGHCASVKGPAHSGHEPHPQSPLQRLRRSRPGKTESRRVETECEKLYPLKADGKLDGGTKGLSTEADCHK
ncbi:unnamed protein product [Pleuronectes platessa]|uniref:Uncharacterized protein n=1 Tax=Pleuronectes platessa TaxID=8262 RepID=A0A9N7TRM5_PLEPL|nr:unnamed protein product [Pleuronectes platessa]